MQKKYKIAVLILILGIVIIIGQKYTQATKQEDVVFAYYNSDTNGWLDDMPEKDNADNLVFEKAVCDDDVTVEWNEDKWAPLVLNLEASQARCTLYFSKPPIHLDKDIPLAKEGQDGLFTVEHNDLSEIKSDWNKTEYRYAGVNPDNYVKFNNELWRIIGLVNVKTSSGIEQRLKIIRTDDIEGQKDFGEYTWGYSFSEWKESELKDMLNGIYYNSKSGDCFPASNDGDKSTCDFSGNDATYPKGLDDTARNMVDSEVIWNTKNYTDNN